MLDRQQFDRMTDIGNPFGFDVATVLTGSGLTLLISAGIMRFGEQLQYTEGQLYGMAGVALVVLGIVYGLLLILAGYR
jgi:multidrug transporter EmrE-like cation transporter